MNIVTICGRLTKAPQKIDTKTGTSMCSFSIAVNDPYTDKQGNKHDDTLFMNCVAFQNQADVITKYVDKGDMLLVAGKLKEDKWTDKDGVERTTIKVVVNKVTLLPNGRKSDGGASTTSDTASSGQTGVNIDGVPF